MAARKVRGAMDCPLRMYCTGCGMKRAKAAATAGGAAGVQRWGGWGRAPQEKLSPTADGACLPAPPAASEPLPSSRSLLP